MDNATQASPPKSQGIPLESISKEPPFVRTGQIRDNQQELRFLVASGEIIMRVPAAMTALDFEILQVYLSGLAKTLERTQGRDGQAN